MEKTKHQIDKRVKCHKLKNVTHFQVTKLFVEMYSVIYFRTHLSINLHYGDVIQER